MNNDSTERDENLVENEKREWNSPDLKTFGTVAEITQNKHPKKCPHGNPYPCPKCTCHPGS